MIVLSLLLVFIFVKQKTAYELRISDWSSDVCSSDLMVNASFLDYRMPVANDLPSMETILVEVPNPGHPYGVRGVGEVPIVPPLGAIANAIYDAVGVRVRDLPASPTRLLAELMESGRASCRERVCRFV